MARLPRLSGKRAADAFQRAGFRVRRQRGSHLVMSKPGFAATLSVPDHSELRPGLLRALIRKAGLTVGQFEELLRR